MATAEHRPPASWPESTHSPEGSGAPSSLPAAVKATRRRSARRRAAERSGPPVSGGATTRGAKVRTPGLPP
ncbi:hypothetical protein GUJ93_ZPchr0011g28361 [Zizania palustris]|uniref:Uncharacterized protein n=1 Tax=Zizania palustris TaxID=103762 RepID=A0A8J6BUH7_ZIZPA|nr:hypothetical protein GUJ93_ZPchr0011g28361 [Zizania palustris]